MINRAAVDDFNSAAYVRMVANNQLRPGLNGGLGDESLVLGQHDGKVADAFVQGNDDKVNLGPQIGDLLLNLFESIGVGKTEGATRRSAWGSGLYLIMGDHIEECSAGLPRRGLGIARPNAVVAEGSNADAVALNNGGTAGIG